MAKINKAQAMKYKSVRDRYRSERASLVTEHNAVSYTHLTLPTIYSV